MRKKLLVVSAIAIVAQHSAQTVLTYIDDGAKFYVSKGALVYSGGSLQLNSAVEKTVENAGNIIIVGNYTKGSASQAASDGKEFVNIYNGLNDYGQTQILGGSVGTNARMTVQRPEAPALFDGDFFGISFPFNDNVTYLMRAFQNRSEADFKGDCGVDVKCGIKRYDQTLMKWNNSKLHHDAVVGTSNFAAGDYYLLNLRTSANIQQVMTGIINYKGTPEPGEYSRNAKGVIPSLSEAAFSNMSYNDWKVRINPYDETYDSYMGKINSTSKTYAKNVYRFGNPYTSNLDLTKVDGANGWLRILNNGGNRSLKEATTDQYIKDFQVTKRTPTYDIVWNPYNGSSNVAADYYSAKFNGTDWVGNPEALIIRPTETFNLNFTLINPTALGGTRIVDTRVVFNDAHKTFAYPASGTTTIPGTSKIAPNGEKAGDSFTLPIMKSPRTDAELAANARGFNQVEIFLLKDNQFISQPIYLVGFNNTQTKSLDELKAEGFEKSDNEAFVGLDQEVFYEFNTIKSVGKPINVDLGIIEKDSKYELRFNLFEGDFFNKVKDLRNGIFYIVDNNTGKASPISSTTSYNFVADNKEFKDRFTFYWKEVPTNRITSNSNTTSLHSTTMLYKDGAIHKIKFEENKKEANIKLYNMAGQLINTFNNVSASTDYTLELPEKGAYIISVQYKDGTERILRALK